MRCSVAAAAGLLMLGGVTLVSAQEPWSIIVCPATKSKVPLHMMACE